MSDRKSTAIRRVKSPSIGRPERFKKHLLIGCAHVPFHNKAMFRGLMQLAQDMKPDVFTLLGDFMDIASLSRYNSGSLEALRDVKLSDEYEAGKKVLDQIDAALPKGCTKQYVYGNHEDRYFRYLGDGDNSKVGDSLVSPIEGLELKERKYKVKTNWKDDFFLLGRHLEATHGFYCTLHTAKKHLEAHQSSVIFAHTHRTQTYITGKRGGFNIGCACDIDSPGFSYLPRSQRLMWSNGFGLVDIDDNGDFFAQVVPVRHGRFFANGRRY